MSGSPETSLPEALEDLKSRLDQSARQLQAFLERNRRERKFRYPFHASYPLNCCESVSLILSYLLEEKYGLTNIRIIRGSKPCGYEHHFWVMAGDWIYDLTAHQFDGHTPLIGVLAHELFLDEFPDWILAEERDFVEREKAVGLYRSGVIPF